MDKTTFCNTTASLKSGNISTLGTNRTEPTLAKSTLEAENLNITLTADNLTSLCLEEKSKVNQTQGDLFPDSDMSNITILESQNSTAVDAVHRANATSDLEYGPLKSAKSTSSNGTSPLNKTQISGISQPIDGCSVPLGMENGLIEDRRISASSVNSNWYFGAWSPFFARLNKQGAVNAWQAKYRDMKQWLQVELPDVMKITGIVTQGAKSLGKEMYVTTYTLKYSDNGIHWRDYAEDEDRPIFFGNTDNNEHVKNFIYPPIFSRFIRIIPRTWMGSITLRVELLGCNFE
uniref:F5/8 type C domain-containing protein n=1 Tax=Hippocampus comes TaxID=109280 RepID=A0A3Q2XE03_HIPCM